MLVPWNIHSKTSREKAVWRTLPVLWRRRKRSDGGHHQGIVLERIFQVVNTRESSHNRALRWLRKAASKAEVGQLEDETALPIQHHGEKPARKACTEPGRIIHLIQRLYRKKGSYLFVHHSSRPRSSWRNQGESCMPLHRCVHCRAHRACQSVVHIA